METLVVYSLITSAAFYLGSRAMITQWLWSRYPKGLRRFMDCAACAGFWYGLIVGAVSAQFQAQSLPGFHGASWWYSSIIIGLCSIVWTPIVAGLMQAGFEKLGTVIDDA